MEYVSKDELMKFIDKNAQKYSITLENACKFEDFVRMCPADDVAPVIHGKWVDLRKGDGDYEFQCSNCKEIYGMPDEDITPLDIELFYCPHCGAKMDLEE